MNWCLSLPRISTASTYCENADLGLELAGMTSLDAQTGDSERIPGPPNFVFRSARLLIAILALVATPWLFNHFSHHADLPRFPQRIGRFVRGFPERLKQANSRPTVGSPPPMTPLAAYDGDPPRGQWFYL